MAGQRPGAVGPVGDDGVDDPRVGVADAVEGDARVEDLEGDGISPRVQPEPEAVASALGRHVASWPQHLGNQAWWDDVLIKERAPEQSNVCGGRLHPAVSAAANRQV